MRLDTLALHAICSLALACAACSKGTPPEATDPVVPPARTLAIPDRERAPAQSPPRPATAALEWQPPPGWIEEPANGMRRAQYRVDGPAGPATCLVFYFGPGMGGDPMANAVRWAQQFEQPDGSSSVDVMQISRLEGTHVPVALVEVTGTYDGGMSMTDAPAERKPDHMLLGAIAEGADAPWFFKLTGPRETVLAERAEFIRMMESLRPGD